MSVKLTFVVSPSQGILVLENLGSKTWIDTNTARQLLFHGGNVDDHIDGQLICCTDISLSTPVVTLQGASWDSAAGDTGSASCDSCQDHSPQLWTLRTRE